METKTPMLSNKQYDVAKYVTQIILPGVGTLYFALAQLWGLPKAEEVVGTIVAVDAFLGLCLGLSSKAYNSSDAKYDGEFEVTEQDTLDIYSLNINDDLHRLKDQKDVVLKVTKQDRK